MAQKDQDAKTRAEEAQDKKKAANKKLEMETKLF